MASWWLGKAALMELLKRSPDIVDAAAQLFRTAKEERVHNLEALDDGLEKLVALQVRQGEEVDHLTRQVEALESSLKAVSRRLVIVTMIAATSLVAAVLLAFRVFR